MIFLIPGLDGSGILFKPFINTLMAQTTSNLSKNQQICVLDYNDAPNQSLTGLTQYIAEKIASQLNMINSQKSNQALQTKLPIRKSPIRKTPIIIIAESFGGLMLDQLLQQTKQTQKAHPFYISHAIFLACFLNRPSHISYFGNISLLSANGIRMLKKLPDALIAKVLFGQYANDEILHLFKQSLEVNPTLYVNRIKTIAKLSKQLKTNKPINTPSLYLQATYDILVSRKNITDFAHYTCFKIKQVPASHFLVETNPEDAVQEIFNFIRQ